MNQQQKKYLRDLLANEYRTHASVIYSTKEVAPKRVIAARKIVAAWDKASSKTQEDRRNKLTAAKMAAEQKILFGAPDEALAAIDKIRKASF
jgi:urocanate hydratase